MGPHAHCKDVCAVLHGLTQFCDTGEFVIFQTCTQQLQTFHQTKRHTGSPIKAGQLILPFSETIDFDPRPSEFVGNDGYSHFFRNTYINSGSFHNAPIMQVFHPSNPYAVIQDHDYLYSGTDDPFDQYLSRLRITEISDAEITDIEKATVGQSSNEMWKQERLKRLSASNFGQICKMMSRTNPIKLAKSFLMGQEVNSDAINYGKSYESTAVSKYESDNGVSTQPCGLCLQILSLPECIT
jgi:hypothetical protein